MRARSMLLVVLAGLSPISASAQDEVTVEALVALVRERSPGARARRARADVAEAEVALAGVYPNPSLGYQLMGRFDGTNQAINGTQHTAWIDVPLLIADQHGARRAAAAGRARVAGSELALELLGLEIEARRAFVELLAAQERRERLARARAELAGLAEVVASRAEAGAQSRYDSARVELAIGHVDARLEAAAADERAAAARVAAVAGRPGWAPRAAGALASLAAAPASREELPAVRAMRARVEAAELDIERAERERVPELALGIGAYLTSDPDSASVVAALAVPLPIFDPGDAAVGAARAARDAAVEERAAVEHEARALLEGRLATLAARRMAVARFERDLAPRLDAISEMAEAAYRLGAAGVFELLDTFGARLDLELLRLELTRAVADAEIDVRAVTGP